MGGSNEVLLVRHGETDYNAADRFQGQLDTPLNERGREQSRALARALAGEHVSALYCSPLSRARETAEIVGAALGLEPVLDARLMEADVGEWAGRLYTEVTVDDPGAFARWRSADPDFRFPGGESVAEQAARVAAALADVAAGPLPALVVAHGGTIRAVDGIVAPRGAVGNCEVLRVPAPAARRS
ncbi:MAG TPA: histidine phosphatase family protein [Solirubrobacteraceae bacterium]|nr:histidine phosphatase family protein [Solirubrobacteraceae bacterium]